MNSAATIMTFDLYKKYLNPEADDQKLIKVGRAWIFTFIVLAGFITIYTMDPNSKDSFFLHVAKHQGNLIAGVVVAFFLGMCWKRATAAGGVAAILSGVLFSYTIPVLYANFAEGNQALTNLFGEKLNFMHGAFISALLSGLVHIFISLRTQPDEEKSALTWIGLKIFSPKELSVFLKTLLFACNLCHPRHFGDHEDYFSNDCRIYRIYLDIWLFLPVRFPQGQKCRNPDL